MSGGHMPAPKQAQGIDAGGAASAARARIVELVFVAGLVVFVLTLAWQFLDLRVFTPDGSVGSGFYPLGLAVVLLVLLAIRLMRVAARLVTKAPPAEDDEADSGRITREQILLAALVIAAIIIGTWAGLFAVVGLFLVVALLTLERVGLRAAVLFTLGTLVPVYLIFDLWLGMNVGLNGLF